MNRAVSVVGTQLFASEPKFEKLRKEIDKTNIAFHSTYLQRLHTQAI